MKEVLLSAKGLCKQFPNGTGTEQVLKNIDIDIYAGDFTVIMGSSGAGKSTLLYALSGMDGISEGKVLYKGKKSVSLRNGRWRACVPVNLALCSSRRILSVP